MFIEWPLERNLEVVREMAALATKHNAPTVVGIQGAFGLTVRKMKEVIDSGRIGKVVSSSWTTNSGNGGATEIKNFRSFVDREIGANLFTIGVGHSLEFLAYGNDLFALIKRTQLTLIWQYWASSSLMIASWRSVIILWT